MRTGSQLNSFPLLQTRQPWSSSKASGSSKDWTYRRYDGVTEATLAVSVDMAASIICFKSRLDQCS